MASSKKGKKEMLDPYQVDTLKNILKYFTDDTENLAVELILRFGSVGGVCDSPVNELQAVEGMNDKIISYLREFPEICKAYYSCTNYINYRVINADTAYNYIKNHFIGVKNESIALLMLNSRGQVIYNNMVIEGSIHYVPLYIKKVVMLCLEYNADTVIIAHNHLSGSPIPSKRDILTTKELQLALEGIYVTLYDHIIIAGDDYTSMLNSGWMQQIEDSTNQFRRSTLNI